VLVAVGVPVAPGLTAGRDPHPFNAASTAWMMQPTVTRPMPPQSKRSQWSIDSEPRAMLTPATISSTDTAPSPSQSPVRSDSARGPGLPRNVSAKYVCLNVLSEAFIGSSGPAGAGPGLASAALDASTKHAHSRKEYARVARSSSDRGETKGFPTWRRWRLRSMNATIGRNAVAADGTDVRLRLDGG
jgi:hypothetical protein